MLTRGIVYAIIVNVVERVNNKPTEYADVVELADTLDLGSNVERHAGSSPVIRTIVGVHNGFKL